MKFTDGIVVVPESVLRGTALDVDFNNPPTSTFAELTKQAEKPGRLAVAAPQIGVAKRIFAVNSAWMGYFAGHSIVVNPALSFPEFYTPGEDTVVDYEGCLSIPGRTLPAVRMKHVLLEAFTVGGLPFRVELTKTAAKIAQHEVDHLNGVLIVDRAREFAENGAPRPQRREIERVLAKLKI